MDIVCERPWVIKGFLGEELRGGVLRGEFGQRHDDCIIGERGGRGSEGWARTAKQRQEEMTTG